VIPIVPIWHETSRTLYDGSVNTSRPKDKKMALKEDIERIALQERELVFTEFTARSAWELGTRLYLFARERTLAIVIDIRRFGQPLFYAALDGTTPDNAEWVRRKSNTVARFHSSSYAIGLKEKIKGETITQSQGLPLADYCTHGGAFPLTVAGAGVIGSITVSGLPQRNDHELVVEALCAALDRNYQTLCLPKGD
jgi:uncharacterized protein (UPF0303 family)